MSEIIAAIVEGSRRRAVWIVSLSLIFAVAGAIFTAGHLTLDTDINKLLNPNLPWRLHEAEMDRAFPQNVDVIAVVIDGATPDLADDASAALARTLAADTALFQSVQRPGAGEFFARNGLLFLSTDEIQKVADQVIAAQPLLGTLAADPSLRGVMDALDLAAQGVIHDETQPQTLDPIFNKVADAVDAALQGKYTPLSWQTILSGREPTPRQLRRFVLAKPKLDYAALQPGKSASEAIHAAALKLGLTPERGVRVRVTGPVALSDAQFATLSRGAGLSGGIALGLLILWLVLGLRSLRIVAAIVVTLLVGLIACGVFTVLFVGALNPISVAFAVLFVGIAVDFGIQFSLRYRDERHRAADFATALRGTATGIGRALSIAAAATAVGFLSFVPTDYSGVSDLGKIAGFGMLVALALNLTLLPALLTLLRPGGEAHPVGFAWATRVEASLSRQRIAVFAVVGIAVAASAILMFRLSFDFNPLHLQNEREEAVSTIHDLVGDPDTTPYTIDVMAKSPEVAAKLSDRLGKLPEVALTISVNSFVPANQAAKLVITEDARDLLTPTLAPAVLKPNPGPDDLLAALRHTAEDLKLVAAKGGVGAARLAASLDAASARNQAILPPLEANLSAQVPARLEALRLSLSAAPVTLESLPPDLRRDWVAADGRARIQVFPKGDGSDNAVLRKFAAAVLAVAPDATGSPIAIQESARTVIRAFATAAIVAVIAIALLLLIVLRRLTDVALVLIPLLLAGLFTLATGVVIGLPLDFANIIALPLLLGIGVAFDIYFVVRWRDGQINLLGSSTARAILFSALTTGTAFGSLALSPHRGTSQMGILLTIALAYTLVCTFIVLPAALAAMRGAVSISQRP